MMDDDALKVALKYGFAVKLTQLSMLLRQIPYIQKVGFDLRDFSTADPEVILIPKYEIPSTALYQARPSLKAVIVAICELFGLSRTTDRIEDYETAFYIVFTGEHWIGSDKAEVMKLYAGKISVMNKKRAIAEIAQETYIPPEKIVEEYLD